MHTDNPAQGWFLSLVTVIAGFLHSVLPDILVIVSIAVGVAQLWLTAGRIIAKRRRFWPPDTTDRAGL